MSRYCFSFNLIFIIFLILCQKSPVKPTKAKRSSLSDQRETWFFWVFITENLLVMTGCLIMMAWCFIFEVPRQVFATILKMIVKCLMIHLFRCIAHTCRITAIPNNILILSTQLSFLTLIESYRLRIKRKNRQNLDRN